MMHLDLALIWAGLLAFAVLAYVVLDGFDLGVGILFPFMPEEKQRDEMMNSVAPVWDGNETWLVLGGGGLFAVFPLAYAIIMPALYAPVIALLLGLVFRGVAFEFRWKTQRGKFLWDGAFAAGSTMAAFAQGIALGALVQGIPVAGRAYAGGWWDWLTPFSVLTGVSLVSRLCAARRDLAHLQDAGSHPAAGVSIRQLLPAARRWPPSGSSACGRPSSVTCSCSAGSRGRGFCSWRRFRLLSLSPRTSFSMDCDGGRS